MLQLYKWRARWSTPQGQKYRNPGRPSKSSFKLQIKNIKLHIVTDIKVNFNSMLGFRISTFGWGDGYFMHQRKYYGHSRTFHACLWFISILFGHPNVRQTCKRKHRRWAHRAKNLCFSERKWKAYGTRCSQAVPHPSTILARRCLTSVIRRERVCSSWYGRRRRVANWTDSHYKTRMLNVCYSYLNGVHAGARHKDKNIAFWVDPRRAPPSYR